MSNNLRVGIIGCGNMGQAILAGLLSSNMPAKNILITARHAEKLIGLQTQFGVETSTNNIDAVYPQGVLILAVKPQQLKDVIIEIAPALATSRMLIISLAAGVRLATLAAWLQTTLPIIRAMPNTPALVKAGMTGLIANDVATAEHKLEAEQLFSSVGKTAWVLNEDQFDLLSALSGSGPAYLFLIMRKLQQAAIDLGLVESVAQQLIVQTVYGAAKLASESKDDFAELQRQVTSPGGTTEQGVNVLDSANLEQLFLNTLKAAIRRSEEMAMQLT